MTIKRAWYIWICQLSSWPHPFKSLALVLYIFVIIILPFLFLDEYMQRRLYKKKLWGPLSLVLYLKNIIFLNQLSRMQSLLTCKINQVLVFKSNILCNKVSYRFTLVLSHVLHVSYLFLFAICGSFHVEGILCRTLHLRFEMVVVTLNCSS